MATLNDILKVKGNHVETISPHGTVLDAAIQMKENNIGALVVMENDRVCGIISERDILLQVVAAQRDPAATRVGEVMTREVCCATPQTSLEEAQVAMKDRRIRHLPVVDEHEKIVGVVSIGDLNAQVAHTKETTIHLLHEYIYGQT
ncbi:MAG: inosine-5-monophosphate dehydrogenase [Gemmatales bacterium]|nr:MAG: inosine-5-monophosphate dehydrogenase [Gemmatales bacterium]